ncbi:MAG: NAD-dependent protein deacylase, partial [Anaerolineae bacterium]|nr:NAD-dependent protein deacylase [Anaerolineae bacterium]
ACLIATFMASGELSRCSECGGILKPDIVLFGEVLPEDVLVEAEEEVASCDLIWVVGSSLVVAPASFLPRYALAHGAGLIIANREPTPLDPLAELILRGDVAELLPAIAAACHDLLSGGRCPHC